MKTEKSAITTLVLLFSVFSLAMSQASLPSYEDLYDPISDVGQYYIPLNSSRPAMLWEAVDINNGLKNQLGQTEINRGLQYYLTAQSMIGLTAKALQEGRTDLAVWMRANSASYIRILNNLVINGTTYLGAKTPIQLLTESFTPETQLKSLFRDYILTDIEGNPESNIYASVASHVHDALIIDVRDSAVYNQHGYRMLHNATMKTTADAWNEFKNDCNNNGLVLMGVQTGGLREFAIVNGFFVINLKKSPASATADNMSLFHEILAWLEPGSPVFGWESVPGGEYEFTEPVSQSGNIMIPYGEAFNSTLSAIDYPNRQQSVLANVIDPRDIDYAKSGKFVSFFLSDGGNVPWMNNRFEEDYFSQPSTQAVKMAHTFCPSNLSMLAPDQFKHLLSQFTPDNTVIELGGGYTYFDRYAEWTDDRAGALRTRAKEMAAHMRQHRIKVLGIFTRADVLSAESKEAYRIMIENNDQLEGVITIQYAPYNGGGGEILWFENSNGISIPVITTRNSIWNFGNRNSNGQGTPRYVANRINASNISSPFSTVAVHAWSKFTKTDTNDELDQNLGPNNNIFGAGAAELCTDDLDANVNVVNLQELIWRVRMHYRPDETESYLSSLGAPTAINTLQEQDEMFLFNNNNTKSLIFSAPVNGFLRMHNINGVLLKEARLDNVSIFNYGRLPTGIYVVKIRTKNTVLSQKISIIN